MELAILPCRAGSCKIPTRTRRFQLRSDKARSRGSSKVEPEANGGVDIEIRSARETKVAGKWDVIMWGLCLLGVL